jgi:hypothetical protein
VVVEGNMGTGSGDGLRSENAVRSHARDGRLRALLLEHVRERPLHPYVFEEKLDTPPWGDWTVHADGRFYVVPRRDRYEIEARDAMGATRLRFDRTYESLLRTREALDELAEGFLARIRLHFPEAEARFLDHYRDVSSIHAGHDGNLWLASSRGTHTGRDEVLCVYDVFDTGGRWLRCAEVRDPHPGAWKGLIMLPGDRVLRRVLLDADGGVHGDDGPEETAHGVVCYRLYRRD